MSERNARHPVMFLREFLKHPRVVASIAPSSRFVERRIVELAGVAHARTVVELGAGSGGTTRAVLDAMPARAMLLAIDINPRFCDLLERIDDARLFVHCDDAQRLRNALVRGGMHAPDAIISGIPFSAMDRDAASSIVRTIWAVLAPGGRFVAYQITNRIDQLSRPLFGRPYAETVLLNVPPLHVYRWRKRDGLPSVIADHPRQHTTREVRVH